MDNIKDNKMPILIFQGDADECYGVLRYFSAELKTALESLGENVIYFDPKTDSIRECFGKQYKAVIGFMETFFYNTLPESDTFLFDLILGPKFNYWPDHPAFYYRFANAFPKDYHILTLDRNYVKYINTYYERATAFFLPPGAALPGEYIPFVEREYEVSFMGTFVDYRDALAGFNSSDEVTRIISETYLNYMINNPGVTTEDAFVETLKKLGANVTREQFLSELCKTLRIATQGAARYYREQLLKVLLEGKITVDVFGDSWKNSPFADNEFLRIHPEIRADRTIDVYRNSKISINIMTWHKDSITERVVDSMAAGSICLTDETPALRESFIDGKDILFYSLDSLERLPDIIRSNVDNEDIALAGKEKVLKEHLWKNRAAELLDIISGL